jgi:4-amino-4-deoxy-L-arabinose transferase-like glycosyltransferase
MEMPTLVGPIESAAPSPLDEDRLPEGRHAQSRSRLSPGGLTALAPAVLVAIQIAAVVTFGVLTIQRFALWSPVDEGAHFDNVIYVAAHGSYPVLGKTPASEQELAIGQGIYPRHTTINPRKFGLGGLSYEAFQPPLYYYVAAPVSLLSGNYHTKAILLRYFGLLLLMASIALLARLSRQILGRRWLLGLSGGLLIFLMPGFILRMVTISNLNLAVPLVVLTTTELWIAWKRESLLRLILCGALVGACILTDLYLFELVPLYVAVAGILIWRKRDRTAMILAMSGAALAGLVVLPWLVFNVVKYHALTATAIAKREQLAIVNPQHVPDTIGQLPGYTLSWLFQPLMPEEWDTRLLGHAFYGNLATLFQVLVVPAAVVLALALGRRLISSGLWIPLLPVVCNVLLCWYVYYAQQWLSGSMVARYMYATLPLLALFSVASVRVLFSAIRPLLVTLALATGFLVALWIFLVPTISSP